MVITEKMIQKWLAIWLPKEDLYEVVLRGTKTGDNVEFVKTFMPTAEQEKDGLQKGRYYTAEAVSIGNTVDRGGRKLRVIGKDLQTRVYNTWERSTTALFDQFTTAIANNEYELIGNLDDVEEGEEIKAKLTMDGLQGAYINVPLNFEYYIKDREGNKRITKRRVLNRETGEVTVERKPATVKTLGFFVPTSILRDEISLLNECQNQVNRVKMDMVQDSEVVLEEETINPDVEEKENIETPTTTETEKTEEKTEEKVEEKATGTGG